MQKEESIPLRVVGQKQPSIVKMSFKDSFVDSDGFCNIDERAEADTLPISTAPPSLNQLIKEKFAP